MSWVRSAVNKAVEGGQNNIRRAVRTYADTVVLHASNAVAGGARIIQDRIVTTPFLETFKLPLPFWFLILGSGEGFTLLWYLAV